MGPREMPKAGSEAEQRIRLAGLGTWRTTQPCVCDPEDLLKFKLFGGYLSVTRRTITRGTII